MLINLFPSTMEIHKTVSLTFLSLQEQLSLGSQVQLSKLSSMFQMEYNILQRMRHPRVTQFTCMNHVSWILLNIQRSMWAMITTEMLTINSK